MGSMKSGMRAAQRAGVPTSSIQMGPRGGRFYYNAHGQKVYGEPPTPHAASAINAARAPKEKQRLAVPAHIVKGQPVLADLEGEGWVKGTVTNVSAKRGVARIKLHDGSGDIEAPFETTKPVNHVPQPKPPKAPKSPPKKPFEVGHDVEVDFEEGWVRGKVTKVNKNSVHVALADGTHAKADHDSIRHAQGSVTSKQGIDRYVTGFVDGNPHFKYQVAKAVSDGGFSPFLEKTPLDNLWEGGRHVRDGGRRYGVYVRSPSMQATRYDISIMSNTEDAAARARAMASATGQTKPIGPHVNLVSAAKTWGDTTADDIHHATLIHEISHHMHLYQETILGHNYTTPHPSDSERQSRTQAHANKMRDRWTVSKYARTNVDEWLAESHTAYVLHPQEFKANDPEGFALVREWRVARGMKP